MSLSPVRVLLVDDSPVVLAILRRMLSSSPEIEVVGTARNGREALGLIPRLQPAVVCTDLHMPDMDGIELTRQIMARYPRSILVVSDYVQKEDTHNVFRLLEAGAMDIFPKPRGGLESDYNQMAQELIRKIKVLSGVVVFRRPGGKTPASSAPSGICAGIKEPTCVRIVAIGASTGGPQALQTILTQLPADFPVPVICVQHISDGFLQGLLDWLASQCKMKVVMAEPGELPSPGTVYFPQEKAHLEFDREGRFTSSLSPPFEGHCPSVTITFKAVANFYGSAAVGVLLTGMGRDGAEGMQTISQAGGITIAQDEDSCVVFGMPKQAIELGAARYILDIREIVPMLLEKIFPKKR
ncbi:MAG: chemotaxis-specific protein-glutamate methyltransferase CheB [Nitrospinae bacterium]|nr:chemotaxis-specific protein-glutamate methyltransferase CheB [Nitrospinota bacterium]